MGCTDPLRMGFGAPHQCPFGSVASFLSYADARWCIPMTHNNDVGHNASLLLHDIHGALVTVNQDGGAGQVLFFHIKNHVASLALLLHCS